ncbi:MAG: aminoacetone oxidase family FAD-binding enzyme [Acidobacteria bacterium]|nr:aminoacetone oxidase family FAD-binding enzyme [Acidobacteriota bacterium]
MVVVVGAGAAGLVAAIFARSSGREVLLLERTSDGGRKILISGGGRCNILPSSLRPERFVSDSPSHLVRGLLRSWSLDGQRAFFEHDVGIPLALEKETGKLFPASNRARDVRDGLMAMAVAKGVTVQTQTSVTDVRRADTPTADTRWRVATSRGDVDATSVVLAAGGLSVPLTGSDGTGLTIAQRLGLEMHPTYPALTPLTGATPLLAALSGISLDVRIRAKWQGHTTESHGGFLFTHRGYSGPSVLDVSHVAVRHPEAVLRVQWTERDADTWTRELTAAQGLVVNVVARYLPERLAEVLCLEAGLPPDRRGPELRRQERTALVDALTSYVLPWRGDEGYKKAEVTGGGVALTDVKPGTLETFRHPGLFICGEMLDAFGPIGGYNFAWAWVTGRVAGLAAGRS